MDNGTPRATERSEGGSKRRRTRSVLYPHQLVLRLDLETFEALERHAKENDRTVAQTARRWLWRGRDIDCPTKPAREIERETFEEAP